MPAPKSDEELAIFQRLVDWIYGQFITKVADSRKLDRAAVQEIAQGRVWSGAEAKKLGLVDEIGGLDSAIKFAAGKAGLGDHFRVVEVPRRSFSRSSFPRRSRDAIAITARPGFSAGFSSRSPRA